MKHKDNAANYALNTAVKVDQNRLMSERKPEALDRLIMRILEYEEGERERPDGSRLLEGSVLDLTEAQCQPTESS